MPNWKGTNTHSDEKGDKFKEDMKYFLVLGRKEVGKSTFINHIIGNDHKARVALKSNDGTYSINVWNGDVEYGIGFIDTPGFGNEGENAPILLVNKITQFIAENKITIVGVIIVDDIKSQIGLETDFIVQITKQFFSFESKDDFKDGDKSPSDNWGDNI